MKNGGILLAKKPQGVSSFDVVRMAKKALNTKKVGHAGTLDPFAEGLLVLGINEGTKALNWLSKEDKIYIAEIELGSTSDTHDIDGEVSKKSDKKPELEEIKIALQQFQGRILQTPPRYSAVKIQGKRACDRMRAGEKIEIKPKTVEIINLEIIDYKYPLLLIKIHSGSGFYVRSLARDLGKTLETGAYCKSLFREKIGNFSISKSVDPEKITEKNIIPLSPEHFNFPSIKINQKEAEALRQGKKIPTQGGGLRSVFLDNEIVCVGEIKNGFLQPLRVFAESKKD